MADEIVHLTSGHELRTCKLCGAALLDASAHADWHNQLAGVLNGLVASAKPKAKKKDADDADA